MNAAGSISEPSLKFAFQSSSPPEKDKPNTRGEPGGVTPEMAIDVPVPGWRSTVPCATCSIVMLPPADARMPVRGELSVPAIRFEAFGARVLGAATPAVLEPIYDIVPLPTL